GAESGAAVAGPRSAPPASSVSVRGNDYLLPWTRIGCCQSPPAWRRTCAFSAPLRLGLLLGLRVKLVQDHLAEVPDTTDSVEPCPHRRVRVAADVLDGQHRLAQLLLVHGGGVLRLRHTPPPAPASCSSVPTGR